AGAARVRRGAPGAGAVAAAPSAARPATPVASPGATPAASTGFMPVASPGATSAAGSHAAPAGPRQLITVTAASYQATYATLTAYRRTGHGWQRVFGPWVARIGRNGLAAPGLKREADGPTQA